MIIYFISPNEEINSLEDKESDLILYIKLKIQEKFGYPFQCQTLKFNKKELEYDFRLYEYKIINEDMLELELISNKNLQDMIIIRALNGKIYFMNVKLSDTIEEIKEKFEEMSNWPEEDQRLVYSGKQIEEDNLTLLDYNIKNGSILDVVLKLRGGGAIDNLIDYENKNIGFDLDLIERNELYII